MVEMANAGIGDVRPNARAVVLVEGDSDRAALEVLASRRGLDLAAAQVTVVAIGGAGNFSRALGRFGPPGLGLRVAGLYDAGEVGEVQRGLARAGVGADLDPADLAVLGFHVCDEDLEDELIRALGTTDNPSLRQQMGSCAKTHAEAHFTMDRYQQALETIYMEVSGH